VTLVRPLSKQLLDPRSAQLVLEWDKFFNDVQTSLNSLQKELAAVQAALAALGGGGGGSTTFARVTASRSLGTVYQNTTGKTLGVSVSTENVTEGGSVTFGNVSANSADLPAAGGGLSSSTIIFSASAWSDTNVVFLVPPDYYYNISTNVTPAHINVYSWVEYTLPA
jgi:hypothetical protein